ncbi:hypothetical protein [Actinomadura sp. 3N407]
MWRDVQAGRITPFGEQAAADLIGASAFGVAPAPESGSGQPAP